MLDFGLARWIDTDESRLTRTGTICGTPRYLSPEQIQGSEVTARADLYSLGVILYEALAGQPPFAGDLDAALIFKHLRQAPPSLPDDVARPAELDGLIERLLAKAPSMRPASASALRRELAGLLERPSAPAARATRNPAGSTSAERRHVRALHVALFDEEALARLDADEAHDLLRRCRTAIDLVRRRHGAFSNAIAAPSVQLVLGAPLARRDDVPRALRAALDVKAALEAVAAPPGVGRPRVGVADGLAVAGGLRDGSNEGYFVTGPPITLAERLSASAAPILVSATLAERAGGRRRARCSASARRSPRARRRRWSDATRSSGRCAPCWRSARPRRAERAAAWPSSRARRASARAACSSPSRPAPSPAARAGPRAWCSTWRSRGARTAERLGLEGARTTALIERAGGHPLLLTELAKNGDASGSLPQSIQALVHARLDRLLEPDRAALTAASVLGPSFRLAELREVIDDRSYACDRLVDYRFVRRSGDAVFMFARALVRDAVYASLVEERRRALHERCAECLRERPALSAMHLERAGSAAAASRYLEAARGEADQHRYESARHLARRGLAAARADADRVPLLALQGEIDLLLGDSLASLESYRAMSELVSRDEDRYQAALGRAAALRIASRYEEALAALDEAATAAERAALPAARLWYLRGGVHFGAGRLEECTRAHERALAMAREADDPVVIANALSGLGDAHYGAGRLKSAAQTWQECIALARADGLLALEVLNLPMLAMASVYLAQALLGLGDLEGARDAARSGLELARARGMHFVGAALSATLATLTEDDGARRALLDEGEAALGARSLSLNRFWFYEIAVAVGVRARGRARRVGVKARRFIDAISRARRAFGVGARSGFAGRAGGVLQDPSEN